MARLPILMYHNITSDSSESHGLTISKEKINKQLSYLKAEGYVTLHFSDLKDLTKSNFPKKAVIITFDDVYESQLEIAYPLIKTYNFKASFFAPLAFLGDVDRWNTSKESIMSVEQLRSLDSKVIEIGLHSFNHINYAKSSLETIEEDFNKCKELIQTTKLSVQSVLAYPYGKYPKKEPQKTNFFNFIYGEKISFGLRIGNRVNRFPFRNNYQIQRLDIKGEDSLSTFKAKLKYGKMRLF